MSKGVSNFICENIIMTLYKLFTKAIFKCVDLKDKHTMKTNPKQSIFQRTKYKVVDDVNTPYASVQ